MSGFLLGRKSLVISKCEFSHQKSSVYIACCHLESATFIWVSGWRLFRSSLYKNSISSVKYKLFQNKILLNIFNVLENGSTRDGILEQGTSGEVMSRGGTTIWGAEEGMWGPSTAGLSFCHRGAWLPVA